MFLQNLPKKQRAHYEYCVAACNVITLALRKSETAVAFARSDLAVASLPLTSPLEMQPAALLTEAKACQNVREPSSALSEGVLAGPGACPEYIGLRNHVWACSSGKMPPILAAGTCPIVQGVVSKDPSSIGSHAAMLSRICGSVIAHQLCTTLASNKPSHQLRIRIIDHTLHEGRVNTSGRSVLASGVR